MSASSPQNDAGPLDTEKTHAVPSPSPSDLVHENAGRLLAGMLGSVPGNWEQEGDVIGPYRLCGLLGEGGFGNVWHAEQTLVIRREVALKVIKPGMDSAQVLGRFNQERQALASLRHPNIAMLLDAGVTPNGRPYFAMELVHGGPVTDWCRAADATLQERLQMFIQICHAVQHAHEKGILHRDIKPTNILVADINGQPVPKVIDFGVAKALNAASLEELTLLTQADQAVGTPLYMSPEQIEGGRELDARSDVYALGVLLYELLTGSQPFDTATAAGRDVEGLKRLILDTLPERPSTRVRRRTSISTRTHRKTEKGSETSLSMLPADLDWITMRALEKDRARRYPSAAELAADVQRHLDCQPVLARPPSISYRTGRWMRRNRSLLVPACAAVTLSVMAVLVFRHFAVEVPAGPPVRHLPSADVPKPTFTNSLGMQFIPVPDTGVLFCIHETRRQDYAAFAAAVPGLDEGWKHLELEGVSVADKDDQPVVGVSWADARAFCAWLSKKEGRHYRLPTHAEWNTAAELSNREQDFSSFPWGVKYPPDEAAGNYADKAFHDAFPAPAWIFGASDGFATTAPVMSFLPNRLGLYDLGGNAQEWCEDLLGPDKKTAARGGGFLSAGRQSLVSSARNFDAAVHIHDNGFRCVVDDTTSYEEGKANVVSDLDPPKFPMPLSEAEMARRTVTNSLGMKFVPVPGTEVLFCIHETRRQDYAAFAAAVPGRDKLWAHAKHKGVPAGHLDDHPVVNTSWEDAQAFCEWLSQKDRMLYRLPTDHEWSMALGMVEEMSSHGGYPSKEQRLVPFFLWGTQAGNYADQAYHDKFSPGAEAGHVTENDVFLTTAPVMSFEANPFGLHDMGGNVEEWCEDWFDVQKLARITRGASYKTAATERLLHSPNRSSDPGTVRKEFYGFRVALEARTVPATATATTPAAAPARSQAPEQAELPPPLPAAEVTRRSVTNSLGMKFVPVRGTDVLFCVHETRRQDYAAYAAATSGVDDTWRSQKIAKMTADFPVACVNVADAQDFCRWLSKKDGRLHRLPTDHEWSLAVGLQEAPPGAHAAGETASLNTTLFPWGTHFPPGKVDGNYADKVAHVIVPSSNLLFVLSGINTDGAPNATSMMSFRSNPFGLYDMGGNVAEWCVSGSDPARETEVQRGGSYATLLAPAHLWSSRRVWAPRSSRRSTHGFRVVMEGRASTAAADPTLSQPPPFEQAGLPAPLPAAEVERRSVTNSLGMKFVPVRGTQVLFCIHETRQQDYAAYAAAEPRVDGRWRTAQAQPSHPVTQVSWDEAKAFCAWLSRKEDKSYRLPTDHEWSFAVGLQEAAPLTQDSITTEPLNTTLYPWGTHFPPNAQDGNYAAKTIHMTEFFVEPNVQFADVPDPFAGTAPVMSFKPNPFGLHDMGGNVYEWCVFGAAPGRQTPVLRGSCYANIPAPKSLRSSFRLHHRPEMWLSAYGFRVVLDVNDSPATATEVEATSVSGSGSAGSVQPPSHPNNLMPVQFEFPPSRTAEEVAKLSVTNSLGMKFLPVVIHGGPTDKQRILFSIWTTRMQDYRVFALETRRIWPKPFFEQGADHPAVNVTWHDANDFCVWLTEKERKAGKILADQSYRLPSDREWSCAVGISELEDATRDQLGNSIGRRAAIYPWGAQATMPDHVGNYLSAECAPLLAKDELPHLSEKVAPNYLDGHATTAPVGSYQPSHLGLYDMGGNVWQWIADKSPPPARDNFIVRGGSWMSFGLFGAVLTRRDGRLHNRPQDDVGFRVVLAPNPP